MDHRKLLLAGTWADGGAPEITTINPTTGEPLAQVQAASADDVDTAVRAGHAAMNDPQWRSMLAHERAALLHRMGTLIEESLESLARLQTLDNGKPITETRALASSAAGTFHYVAAALETLDDAMPVSRGPYFSMSVHEPIGVVGAITPWNSPIASEAQKMAPALAAGNAIVLKPAVWTPLVALELGRLALEAGFPKRLISVLPGRGAITGEALVAHPLVRKISFTGGTVTGRHVGKVAAEKVMPVSLELGGKSPTIVFNDADLDLAVRGVLYGIFSSQGQACIAGSRLFVQRSIFDEFISRLVEEAGRITIGDPNDERTLMGPLIGRSHCETVHEYVDIARAEGGQVLTGGEALSGGPGGIYDRGSFYPPTIITGLDNSATTTREEVFGPVLVAMPFGDEDDLMRQANDSCYGLACGIWTGDYKRAWRLSRALETGTVWINAYKLLSAAAPFGGVKESGLGREKGRTWIQEYQSQKSLYWGINEQPTQWTSLDKTTTQCAQ